MARLFITPREIDFISDITKEITKDVIGQVIYYYKPRVDLSKIHDIYSEATEKVFDPPVEIDCRINWGATELKHTGDKRALVSDEVLSSPLSSGETVQPTTNSKSSFYGDDS